MAADVQIYKSHWIWSGSHSGQQQQQQKTFRIIRSHLSGLWRQHSMTRQSRFVIYQWKNDTKALERLRNECSKRHTHWK